MILLDSLALVEATTLLALDDPITVEIGQYPPDGGGSYLRDDNLHLIYVNRHQTEQELSRTIWHELMHAKQCERDYLGNGPRYHDAATVEALATEADGRTRGIEGEARMTEDFDNFLRLVRTVTSGQ